MNETTPQPVLLLDQIKVEKPVDTVQPVQEEKPKKEREVAYVLNDKYFKGFEVLKTYNGWWKDKIKVETLIQNFKNGYNQEESRVHTGLSEMEYRYFKELHPDFYHVIEACELHLNMVAESGNAKLLYEGDGSQIRWFLERRKPEKYAKASEMAPGQTLNNFGTIISTPAPKVPQSVLERMNAKKEKDEL